MRKLFLLFVSSLLCLGAWAQETTPLADSEWQLLQDLRTNLIGQGSEYMPEYWSLDNGKDGVPYWEGVTVSDEGHVTDFYLDWDFVVLDTIPPIVFEFPYLQSLRLVGKGLTGRIESIAKPGHIACADSLKALYLANNRFSGNIGALAPLLPNLETLDVENNRISEIHPMVPASVVNFNANGQDIDEFYVLDLRAPLTHETFAAMMPEIMQYDLWNREWITGFYKSFSLHPSVGDWSDWFSIYYDEGQWILSGLFRYTRDDTLYLEDEKYAHCPVHVLYKDADADFNGTVDIVDLQLMLNYILGEWYRAFNFTACNLYRDSILNVQDVVLMVDTLLTREVPVVFESPRRVASTEPAEAALYWQDGDLHLYSSKAVASMQISLDAAVNWQLTDEWVKGERVNGEGTNVVIYSLNGATLPAETDIVLAHSANEVSVRYAALADTRAQAIDVRFNSPAVATKVESGKLKVESGKILRNGQLIIIRGNKMYNAQGIEL